jgi:hypothetical protein
MMLSHSIHELRQATLSDAHGGRVMSGDDMVALAAKLAAFEAAAGNLEAQVKQLRIAAQLIANRPAGFRPLDLQRPFGRRGGTAR